MPDACNRQGWLHGMGKRLRPEAARECRRSRRVCRAPERLAHVAEHRGTAGRWRGRTTSIVAGPYDTLYFGDGWQPRQQLGNQVVRFVEGALGTLRVPLVGGRAYRVVLRLDPNPDSSEPAAIVGVSLNRERLLPLRLTYDPERIGSYELLIPAGWTRTGLNRLDLLAVAVRSPRVAPGGTEPSAAKSAFMIWYVRFEPLPEMSVP